MRIESGRGKEILHYMRDQSRGGVAGSDRTDSAADAHAADVALAGGREASRQGKGGWRWFERRRRRHCGVEVFRLHLLWPVSWRLAFRVLDFHRIHFAGYRNLEDHCLSPS